MDNRTFPQQASDWVTAFSGSWSFIFWSSVLLGIWIWLNVSKTVVFDEYPFILLNLGLTIVSTFQSPLILMSNNRMSEVDRERVAEIVQKLDEISEAQKKILRASRS